MKKILIYVALVLVSVLLVSGLGFMTKGFTEKSPENWTVRERNELNLFDNTQKEAKEWNQGTGITVTMNKDGSVKVNGTHGGSEAVNIELGEITLEAGTYTFTSGYKSTGLYTMYLKLVLSDGFKTADFGDDIVLDKQETAKVVLVICPDTKFNNVTLYPVIAKGTEAVSFYK